MFAVFFFIPVKPLTFRMIFKSRLGSEHDKSKNSDTTEKQRQQQQRTLSITEKRKCERVRRLQGAIKTKLLKIVELGNGESKILLSVLRRRTGKRRMRIAFSCQMLLSHDHVRQIIKSEFSWKYDQV